MLNRQHELTKQVVYILTWFTYTVRLESSDRRP